MSCKKGSGSRFQGAPVKRGNETGKRCLGREGNNFGTEKGMEGEKKEKESFPNNLGEKKAACTSGKNFRGKRPRSFMKNKKGGKRDLGCDNAAERSEIPKGKSDGFFEGCQGKKRRRDYAHRGKKGPRKGGREAHRRIPSGSA